MRPIFLISLTLTFLLVPGTALLAQESTFEETVEVAEVLLDVMVTDRDGNVIVGLGADDFVVTEGGEEVPLETASFYSNREVFGAGADSEIEPDPRYFILFLHDRRRIAADLPGIMSRQIELGRQSRQWVEEEMLSSDWVAVVRYDERLHIHSDFTRDRTQLGRALNDAVTSQPGYDNWPSRVGESSGPSLLATLPRGKELAKNTTRIYDALEILAEATEPIVGRKNLIFFGTGFGVLNSFGQYQADNRYFDPMVRTLNTRNVAVYTVDMIRAGTKHVMSDSLYEMANETGGDYYFDSTTFLTPIRKIAKETNGYYLLGYRRERPLGSSGYQKVEVKSRNPEFRVKARQGYRYGG